MQKSQKLQRISYTFLTRKNKKLYKVIEPSKIYQKKNFENFYYNDESDKVLGKKLYTSPVHPKLKSLQCFSQE